jgi:hypothetical protein
MIIAPKFFENSDNNHCLQASVLMCVNSLGRKMSFKEIDELIGYNKSLYTWLIQATNQLQKMFPGVKFMSNLDYKKISVNAEKYLKNKWKNSLEHYNDQESHALPHFTNVQNSSKEFLKNGGTYEKISKKCTKSQLSNFLEENLVIMWVNWNKLYDQPGSKGHFVVVFSEKDSYFIIHDSGQPPRIGKKVKKDRLLEAGGNDLVLIPKEGSPIGKLVNKRDICYCKSGRYFSDCHMKLLKRENKTMLI